jgi:hypothetical protein
MNQVKSIHYNGHRQLPLAVHEVDKQFLDDDAIGLQGEAEHSALTRGS